jgi:hypothetical protein
VPSPVPPAILPGSHKTQPILHLRSPCITSQNAPVSTLLTHGSVCKGLCTVSGVKTADLREDGTWRLLTHRVAAW